MSIHDGVKRAPTRIAAGVQPVLGQVVRLQRPGMGVEDVAETVARRHRLLDSQQRVAGGLEQLLMALATPCRSGAVRIIGAW